MVSIVLVFTIVFLMGCTKQTQQQGYGNEPTPEANPVQPTQQEQTGNDLGNPDEEGNDVGGNDQGEYGEGTTDTEPTGKTVAITVTASKFQFDPSTITVKKGDIVTLTLETTDVSHGLAIEGYDVDVKSGHSLTFTADKAGTFPFKCSVVCGSGHSSMQGTFVVEE